MISSMYERIGLPADLAQQLLFVLNGSAVHRYHTTPTIKSNTVGAHSFGVAWLCYILSPTLPRVQLIMAALAHDLAEQVSGDIPSPVKWRLGMAETFSKFETVVLNENEANFQLTEQEAKVLALADAMDGLLFCVQERRLGNRNMEVVYHRYRGYIINGLGFDNHQQDVLAGINRLWEETCGN